MILKIYNHYCLLKIKNLYMCSQNIKLRYAGIKFVTTYIKLLFNIFWKCKSEMEMFDKF